MNRFKKELTMLNFKNLPTMKAIVNKDGKRIKTIDNCDIESLSQVYKTPSIDQLRKTASLTITKQFKTLGGQTIKEWKENKKQSYIKTIELHKAMKQYKEKHTLKNVNIITGYDNQTNDYIYTTCNEHVSMKIESFH